MSEQGRESLTETALRAGVVVACLGFVLALLASGPLRGLATTLALTDLGEDSQHVVVGSLLAGVGVVLSLVGGASRWAGLMALLIGAAWLATVPATSVDGSDQLRGPAQAVALLAAPALLGLAIAIAPPGRIGRRTMAAAAILLALVVLVAALRLATYDPFADPTCVNCGHGAQPLLAATAEQRKLLNRLAAALALVGACGVLLRQLGREIRGRRRIGGDARAVVAGSTVLAVALAAGAATQLASAAPVPASGQASERIIGLAGAVGAGVLALGLAWRVIDVLRLRLRMRRLAGDVASATALGRLDVQMANALGDPSVVVGYWHESEAGWVSAAGMPRDPPPADADHGQLTIERGGKPIAAIWHRGDIDPGAIRKELTSSFLVALDNERLQAVGMASLRLLRESRARLVSEQEVQRRQVERDLHDGLQQRLLAIVFDLRLARAAAERIGDRSRSRWLEQAEGLALALVEEVRRLARGIYPAILGQAGLAAALSSLADEAPIPMSVSVGPVSRLPPSLEATVYQVVAEALADAVRNGAAHLTVTVDHAGDDVALLIDHDGFMASVRLRLVDRVAAAGGRLIDETSGESGGGRLRIALPCG
ncbi:MAG TPA: histidine kinase [Candidatus Limnocylindrales bacterium]|nr:histidine kinase [Candidatus Limnocylindrales bacterium]